ncbi:hypothetical protein [Paenibacillus pini]|uniref:Uncharacterized protein n=1 Tax=Paenibacillus pini JCM 16418 TaxID=1236976 RepID=W7YWJ0_9BACL|nr:hypothetical protein [Paenibacillus pini]GAF09026.1 hypothetical protein JCM16418_3143 [Paenibacillus pini JCM 16418]
MNTSSFLSGVLIGAAATTILAKKKGSLLSSVMGSNGNISSLGLNSGSGSHSSDSNYTGGSSSQNHSTATGHGGQAYSKETSLNQVKDFIRNNPEVKQEVDMILKETNTVIPGL